MNYYLNAFNEMQRRRQMQNQMGGQDVGQGRAFAGPSGPDSLGLGPAQDRSAFRDTMRDMPPALGYALGMIPGVNTGLSLAKAVNYGMGKAAEARNAIANQQMSEARQAFRTGEIADRNAAMQNTPQQAFRSSEISGMNAPMQNTPQQAFQAGEKNYSPVAPPDNFLASLFGPNVSLTPALSETREATPNPAFNFGKESSIPSGGIISPGVALSRDDRINAVGSTAGGYGGGAGAPGANADGFGGGDAGFGGGSKAFNQGGMVTPERLMGQAPAPDDGYGALQGGEYVITKAAVERYGKAMMDAINNGTFR